MYRMSFDNSAVSVVTAVQDVPQLKLVLKWMVPVAALTTVP